jgi:hypothetical protein
MLCWNIHVNMHCWNFSEHRIFQSSGFCKICRCCNTLLLAGILVLFICIIFSIKLFALWYLNFVSPWYIFIRLERKLLIILYHETRAFFYNWPIIYINAIAAASWLLEKGLCLKRLLRSDSVIQACSDHVSLSLLFQEVTRESSFKSLANSNSSLHERENHLDRCHKFSKDLICHTGLVSG